MSTSLLPLLDSALTELEVLEKRLEQDHISDAKNWPALSLAIRKLASTSVELVSMPETRNRTNRAQMISFCARFKAIALVFNETMNTRETRGLVQYPTPGSGKIARSGKPPSTGKLGGSSASSPKELDALLQPELKHLIQRLSANASDLVEFEWSHAVKLGPQATAAVVEPLNWRNTHLRTLRLSNQALGDLGVSHVAKALKSNRSIVFLDISGNSITSKGVESLVDAVLANQPSRAVLERLDLSHNLIDFAGCGHIARLVTNAETLHTLLLNNNLINDVGLTTIGNALALNCSLTRLDLQQNPASHNVSIGPIFTSVLDESNYSVTKLDLGGARLNDAEIVTLNLALDRNVLLADERLATKDHASPKENAFKRMQITAESACLHVFSPDVMNPSAILKLVTSPLGANITSLIITNIGLSKLPPQLCLMGTHLEVLDIRRNRITSLPLEIRGFFKLVKLHLAHNRLQHLPSELTYLHTLNAISLHGNPLQWIPQEMVSHAEIEDFPPADTRLFKFLTNAANSTDEPNNDLFGKIVVLGAIHSGKTSLCQVLDCQDDPNAPSSLSASPSGSTSSSSSSTQAVPTATLASSPSGGNIAASSSGSTLSNSGSSNPTNSTAPTNGWSRTMSRYISTEGVCSRTITIRGSKYSHESVILPVTPEATAITKKVQFSVLEAGGSAIYSSAHSIFFKPDLLYLLAVDLTKLGPETSKDTIADLKNTIQTIQTMVGSSHDKAAPYIAIVGTFEDLLSPAACSDALALLKFHFDPHVLEVLSISNRSSRGLSILRDRVLFWAWKSKLLVSPQLGCISTIQSVLKSYAMTRPFISRSELEQICRVYGVEREAEKFPFLSSSPSFSPRGGTTPAAEQSSPEPTLNASPTSSSMKVDEAIQILESLGAVMTFHTDTQLQCYAFIDPQFIGNVFSDIMASADADGYIYRSHVPPLLWMDCRRFASMRSLFDWCRLFGLALDCGDSHFIIPSLLNKMPQIAVYNAAWPPMENIDGVSSRPHQLSPVSSSGYSANSLATLPTRPISPPPASIRSLTSSPPSAASLPPSSSRLPAQSTIGPSSNASTTTISDAISLPLGSIKMTPAVEKHARAYHREMGSVACAEWPVLVRGVVTEFVPSLIFSHIMIACFSRPGIQRSAWWKNGFIARRDTAFVKVVREFPANAEKGCKILVEARNDNTFTMSKDLLEEICTTIDQLLKSWYKQFEYTWSIPWSHPWIAEVETDPISFDSIVSALKMGPVREPTMFGNITIREELLTPELIDSNLFFQTSTKISGLASLSASSSGSSSPRSPRSSGNDVLRTYRLDDGTLVRFRETSSAARTHLALVNSVLRNERIATLHGVYEQPSGLAVIIPRSGSMDEVLQKTYNDAPLPWAARFRIAVDIVLAVRYLHSQVPVLALQGLDASSVLLSDNFADANAIGPIARIDLSAMNSQEWLGSVFAPRPFTPSSQQIQHQTSTASSSSSSLQSTIKLLPHAADIYSLGVLLLQLWRNEPLDDFTSRIVRDKRLPPVPFYSPESLGFLAFEQLIAGCVCDDPTMRPQIEQIITKMSSIAAHLELASAKTLLAAHEPSKRWRKIKEVQVSSSADMYLAVASLCKSTTLTVPKPGVAAAFPSSKLHHLQMDETVVWAGAADGVLYGLPFPLPNMTHISTTAPTAPSSVSLTSSSGSSMPAHESLASLGGFTSHASYTAYQAIHWATLSASVLDNATVQYRLASYPPETRDTRRRIISTIASQRHIWCLLNSVTASVLDPSRNSLVAQVEIGPCYTIAAYEDTVYTGGTTGMISAFDGSSCKRLRQREVSKLAITAIVANDRFVWIAVTDDPGTPANLICLDAFTFQTVSACQHPSEETITALAVTSVDATTSYLWTGGYSGCIQTFKISTSPFADSEQTRVPEITVEPFMSFPGIHNTRNLSFLWDGDFLYSSSSDAIAAWKADSSGVVSKLLVPAQNIASFTVLEKSAIITGHKDGSLTIWASF